jgi:group I intron endonuclease
MTQSGIYKIQSICKPERCYIGSAINIRNRWRGHLNDLKRNKHSNNRLQNHFKKYGESDLQFSILLGCEKEDLIKIEQYFIDSYNPWFNICKIAGNSLGTKRSIETRRKISEHQIGRIPWNKGTKGIMIPWNKGKKGCFSKETIKLMSKLKNNKQTKYPKKSIAQKILWLNTKHQNKMSESAIKAWKNPRNKRIDHNIFIIKN